MIIMLANVSDLANIGDIETIIFELKFNIRLYNRKVNINFEVVVLVRHGSLIFCYS